VPNVGVLAASVFVKSGKKTAAAKKNHKNAAAGENYANLSVK
jgi:hypothetical protein